MNKLQIQIGPVFNCYINGRIRMNVFTILLCLMTAKMAFGAYHPFPDSHAIWNTSITNSTVSPDRYYRFTQWGDTLINSRLYHKLYFQVNDTTNIGHLFTFIREDSLKRIYIYGNDSTDVLLYDFSKDIGDTIWHSCAVFPYGPLSLECDEYSRQYQIVTGVDSVLIDDEYHKTQHFYNSSDYFNIEGIGSNRGLFDPIMFYPTDASDWNLYYFYSNGTRLYYDSKYDEVNDFHSKGPSSNNSNSGHTLYSIDGRQLQTTSVENRCITISVYRNGKDVSINKTININF